jgi:hypothetical protein
VGELTRFTLVRDVQRREPAPGSGFPLLPATVNEQPQLLVDLSDAVSSEGVAAICYNFLADGGFVAAESVRDHPLGRLSAWLRVRDDRVTVAELVNDSPLAGVLADRDGISTHGPEEGPQDNLWVELRVRLAESFVVAMLQEDADPSVAPALNRLLLVAGLAVAIWLGPLGDGGDGSGGSPDVLALAGNGGPGDGGTTDGDGTADEAAAAERKNIHAALHLRRVLLPEWLSRYPELTRRDREGLLRRSQLVREPAVSDYYVVEDEWARYEAAEIAYIENVLPRETKSRVHVRQTETETTTTAETERTEVTEKDTQQTDSTEFSAATQTEMNLSFGLDLSVDTQGQYGPTAVQTHLAAQVDGSLETAQQTAFRVSREVTARAGSRVAETTRTARTTRSLTRITETNQHGLSNGDSDLPVVGMYRWVEQIRRLRVMRYPNRYLLEFLVPEPAAWWRWLATRSASKGVSVPTPTPFTANGQATTATNLELTAAEMVATAAAGAKPLYLAYAGRYGTVGIEPPPSTITLATAVERSPGLKQGSGATGIAKPSNDYTLEWNKDATLSVPAGWEATSWRASILAWHDDHFPWNNGLTVWVSAGAGPAESSTVGEGQAMSVQLTGGQVGPIATGSVPVGIMLDSPFGYHIAVEVTCTPTAAAITRWQQRTYEAVRQAYDLKMSEYREAVSAAATRAGVPITGLSPAGAREVEQAELKKHVISLLRGRGPQAPVDPWDRSAADSGPNLKLNQPPRDELMFLEEAMEWENMRYVHYPYFWADDEQWEELAAISSSDPLFAAFLRAGSTRVVVPARPSFEDAVNFYTKTLIPWGGLGAPAPDEDGYLSIADEVAAIGRAPLDGSQVGLSWEIRLPTELTCLRDDELPTNAHGRIPPPPVTP